MQRLIGGLLVALVVLGIGAALWSAGPSVDEESVLVLELGGRLEESPPVDTLGQLLARGQSLPTLLMLMDMAVADSRIDGVLVHVRPLSLGFARIQELRDKLAEVSAAGKKVAVLLDLATLNATREIYLASAADEVYVVPGFLGPFAGIAGQYLHMAGFFEKIGVHWEYSRVGEFKSAVETFAAHGMSDSARKMTNELLDGVFRQIVDGVAEGRGLDPDRVRELIDRAPATAQEYVTVGLANGISDRHEVLKTAGMGDATELSAESYQRVGPNSLGLRDGPKIALIFGDGAVVQTGSRWSRSFETDRVSEAVEDAADDDEIRAIVLRINSGGGSALASEQLWRVLMRAREKKPIVVSMADAAASGGYYVASAAHAIFAEPATFTGSIGVFLMRPAFSGLYEKLAINTEVIARGRHASVSASDQPMTSEQLERTSSFVRALYREFLERVSEARNVDIEAVDRVGQGHVWLGETALELGLIDGIGGLSAAVERAKQEADIPGDVDPARVILPGPRSRMEQVRELFSSELPRWLAHTLLPVELPEILSWAWIPARGEVAFLPPHWVEIY